LTEIFFSILQNRSG
jgi:hypothetical protein